MDFTSCKVFYIGRTKRRLQDRLAEHKYDIHTENINYPMASHYLDFHNSNPSTLQTFGTDPIATSI